jgi:uncharacterized protein
MNDGRFQWDDEKAASNYGKHGVRFEAARNVFKDPFAVELIDDRHDYGEDRFVLIASVQGILLTVVYTERQARAGKDKDRIRIISARHATRQEQDEYYKQNI